MKKCYVINTNFEAELTGIYIPVEANPISSLLQFLPSVYAESDAQILVSHHPEPDDSRYITECNEPSQIITWGWSKHVQEWSHKQGHSYHMPPWESVCKVNSKLFSFELGPKLPGAFLAYLEEDLKHVKTGMVLKTCFGYSGRGHHHFRTLEEALNFCQNEWKNGRPVIVEPWMERDYDFSTQWKIDNGIEFIGFTGMKNSSRGTYQGTIVDPEVTKQMEEHYQFAKSIVLPKLIQEGYFGYVGLDAMVHSNGKLHPLVEINARQTMAMTMIWIRDKLFSGKRVFFFMEKTQAGLLPNRIKNGAKFNKQLNYQII